MLDLARSGAAPSLRETFSVHGILDSPDLSAEYGGSNRAVSGRVMVFHGEEDPFIPPHQLVAFQDNMRLRGANYEMITFPGAKHAFTRPEKTLEADVAAGLAYNDAACARTWDAIRTRLQHL